MPQHDDYESYDEPPRRRRGSLMDERLRARAAANDDDDYGDDDDYDYGYDDRHRGARLGAGPVMAPAGGGGSGCAQAVLYLVLGALAALVIVGLLLGNTVSNVAGLFGNVPSLQEVVASPTPTFRTDSAAVVRRIQQLSRLETTSYTIEKVIEAGIGGNTFEELLFGDRLLLIANGNVVAGMDLSQLTAADVVVVPDGSRLTVTLPEAQIFDVSLNNERTRVYDRQQGLLAGADRDLESEARRVAEGQILAAACEDGIMQRATEDGQRAMEQFLSLLEFEQAEVRVRGVPPCPTS